MGEVSEAIMQQEVRKDVGENGNTMGLKSKKIVA